MLVCEESSDEHLMTVDEESDLMMVVEGLADSSKDDEGSEAAEAVLACVGLPNQSMACRRCSVVDDCHSSFLKTSGVD